MAQNFSEKQVWKGAVILTIAGLLTKVLSAGYRVPYQNIAGDIGFYIYQQVYPFYGLALVLAMYGFPVVISKLIVENDIKKDTHKILKVSFVFLQSVCLVLFLSLYFSAELIAMYMGDTELFILIKVISFIYLFIPLISVFRGYFQGINDMVPTAVSQILEQFIRVGTILILSYLLLSNGYSFYISGAGAVFGSITGGVCSVLVLSYFWYKKKENFSIRKNSQIKSSIIIKMLIINSVMICASHLFLVLLQLIDSLTVYSLLIKTGINEEDAKVLKGVFDRGQPLLQLGTIITTSISLSIIPLLSSEKAKKDSLFLKSNVKLAQRIGIIVGTGASVGLVLIMKSTNIMLFEDSRGSLTLSILALSIISSSKFMTSSAILQGLDKPFVPLLHVMYGLIVKSFLNLLLIPYLGIIGAAISTVLSFVIASILNDRVVLKQISIKREALHSCFSRTIFVAAGMMVLVLILYQYSLHIIFETLEVNRLFATFQALSSVCIGALTYIYVIIRKGIFTESELSVFPLGGKLQVIRKLGSGKRV